MSTYFPAIFSSTLLPINFSFGHHKETTPLGEAEQFAKSLNMLKKVRQDGMCYADSLKVPGPHHGITGVEEPCFEHFTNVMFLDFMHRRPDSFLELFIDSSLLSSANSFIEVSREKIAEFKFSCCFKAMMFSPACLMEPDVAPWLSKSESCHKSLKALFSTCWRSFLLRLSLLS